LRPPELDSAAFFFGVILLGRNAYSLAVPRALVREIEALAAGGYPHESCGLLLGVREGAAARVSEVTAARNLNTERAHDRYVLDPDDFVRADRRAAETGREVVGVWHSHPDHPARPSSTDREAAWAGYSYVIVSVARGQSVDIRSWRLDDNYFLEERMTHE
jgi:proteasome lid subunit RPN8/RPN11